MRSSSLCKNICVHVRIFRFFPLLSAWELRGNLATSNLPSSYRQTNGIMETIKTVLTPTEAVSSRVSHLFFFSFYISWKKLVSKKAFFSFGLVFSWQLRNTRGYRARGIVSALIESKKGMKEKYHFAGQNIIQIPCKKNEKRKIEDL